MCAVAGKICFAAIGWVRITVGKGLNTLPDLTGPVGTLPEGILKPAQVAAMVAVGRVAVGIDAASVAQG